MRSGRAKAKRQLEGQRSGKHLNAVKEVPWMDGKACTGKSVISWAPMLLFGTNWECW